MEAKHNIGLREREKMKPRILDENDIVNFKESYDSDDSRFWPGNVQAIVNDVRCLLMTLEARDREIKGLRAALTPEPTPPGWTSR
jgi:hypothetical protein